MQPTHTTTKIWKAFITEPSKPSLQTAAGERRAVANATIRTRAENGARTHTWYRATARMSRQTATRENGDIWKQDLNAHTIFKAPLPTIDRCRRAPQGDAVETAAQRRGAYCEILRRNKVSVAVRSQIGPV